MNTIILPKIGEGPEQAPMVWLEGGPGVPGTISAALYTTDLKFHRARRAVVLFDQRGTGRSHPLHCPAIERRGALDDEYRLKDVTACRRALATKAELAAYSTEASVADLEALRKALSAEKLDLAALSYGTWLAQAYMEQHPERVRSAVLIGTVPIGEKLPLHHVANAERALRLMFSDCQADRDCNAAFPHLPLDWRILQAHLATPVVIHTPQGVLLIRRGPLNELIRTQLNSVESTRRLPLLISRAAQGDYAPLIKLARAQEPQPEAEGLYLSITCPEATARIRPGEIDEAVNGSSFGGYRVEQQIAACRAWSPGGFSPRSPPPLKADIPVLLLAGGRDATTTPAWAQAVSAKLPVSRVVIIEPMSHLPVGLTHIECLDRMADAFFAKPSSVGLDTSCVATMEPPPFATH